MIKKYNEGFYYCNGKMTAASKQTGDSAEMRKTGRDRTIAWNILKKHNSGTDKELKIKFDALASHDITYVGIIQTARASGLKKFPVPYVLTNCHNSLCAVGGTINEDDHLFGLSAAEKYGGIYVPAHQAVIHQYMREMMAGCGKMILGSDSHTRYGAIGTMGIGEGGPELVKQLLSRTYDVSRPEVTAVYFTGSVRDGVGPQDVALAIIREVFADGFVKNKVMEFVGPGISGLSMDFRNGIDVMTTETTCLSSIWQTDEAVRAYLEMHGRAQEYSKLAPEENAYYDSLIEVDLSTVKPMIALPFHPSNAYTIEEFLANASEILAKTEKACTEKINTPGVEVKLSDKWYDGAFHVDQAVVAGCSGGTFENINKMAYIMKDKAVGNGALALSVYPSSQPVYLELLKNGTAAELMTAGASLRSAFCGPCFGAGDVPINNGISIRHSTRNFPNREGSKPSAGQISTVALMDAMSIAATAANGGRLTAADSIDWSEYKKKEYKFDSTVYDNRVYYGFGEAKPETELRFGPNITDWPAMSALTENLILPVVSVIRDEVTTTDELIPSGETSSYRSNPLKLAEFALSRRDPEYVGRAKKVHKYEQARLGGGGDTDAAGFIAANTPDGICANVSNTGIGSVIFANKPGDGSAREQAASCQKVLGGWANIAVEYATKRYRSNLINWGMLPLQCAADELADLEVGDTVFLHDVRKSLEADTGKVEAYVLGADKAVKQRLTLRLAALTDDERQIILDGCLINYYRR